MTDHGREPIRDALTRAMADAPAPLAWGEVERRADGVAVPSGRHRGAWLAAAACTVALVVGAVVL
ncbi:MAG: hypothetical protein ACR2OH_04695, partial [Microthrixaceae bacterium]